MADERISEVRATLSRPETRFFIAEYDTTTVGMAAAIPYREDLGAGSVVPGVSYLDLLFVLPERWGEGVGSLLLDTVIADARRRGFEQINLLTHDDNDRAQALYRSRGFERTGVSRLSSNPANGIVSEWSRAL
jgi:ribosomal protein S18 acetylase RimI-like enzyme